MFKRFIASAVIFAAGFALCAAINAKGITSLANESTAQKPATPQWEYRVLTRHIHGVGGNEDYGLSALGAQGFEVSGVSQSAMAQPNLGYHLTIVLRRPKQ